MKIVDKMLWKLHAEYIIEQCDRHKDSSVCILIKLYTEYLITIKEIRKLKKKVVPCHSNNIINIALDECKQTLQDACCECRRGVHLHKEKRTLNSEEAILVEYFEKYIVG